MNLKNKVALVTGSTRGIGRAIALAFAKKGVRVVINGRKDMPEDLRMQLQKIGTPFLFVQADISKEDDIKAMLKSVYQEFGKVDILVNNAGITKDQILIGMKTRDFDSVMNVNLRGTFMVMQKVIKKMFKAKSGCIINLASVVGLHGNIGQANYAASKAGVIGLTKTAAKEGAVRNIRVNAIAPGMIDSDMTEAVSEEAKQEALKQIPLKQFGNPADIAHAAVFLAENDYITGQVLVVDGGMTI